MIIIRIPYIYNNIQYNTCTLHNACIIIIVHTICIKLSISKCWFSSNCSTCSYKNNAFIITTETAIYSTLYKLKSWK